eukprot:11216194-Lingulodinium_polyedra.AAC.1
MASVRGWRAGEARSQGLCPRAAERGGISACHGCAVLPAARAVGLHDFHLARQGRMRVRS